MEDTLIRCRQYIESHLKPSRVRHIDGVCEMAVRLAERYGEDRDKAYTAALFHDICKSMSADELDKYIDIYGLDSEFAGSVNLSHGPAASCIAQMQYGIDDPDILNAIKYHTVARAGMSMLEKIIYVADAIEPGRKYPEAEKLRHDVMKNFDGVFEFILRWSVEDIISKGRPPSKYTIGALLEASRKSQANGSDKSSYNTEKTKEKGNMDQNKSVNTDSKAIALKAGHILSDRKADDIVLVDIAERSGFADYFVIATGSSERQIENLIDYVEDGLAEDGVLVKNIEGRKNSGWILMDFGDVIVNLFSREMREKYNIEKVWGDCTVIDIE